VQNLCVLGGGDISSTNMAHFLNTCVWIALFAGAAIKTS
jgi:hypothetical protein